MTRPRTKDYCRTTTKRCWRTIARLRILWCEGYCRRLSTRWPRVPRPRWCTSRRRPMSHRWCISQWPGLPWANHAEEQRIRNLAALCWRAARDRYGSCYGQWDLMVEQIAIADGRKREYKVEFSAGQLTASRCNRPVNDRFRVSSGTSDLGGHLPACWESVWRAVAGQLLATITNETIPQTARSLMTALAHPEEGMNVVLRPVPNGV